MELDSIGKDSDNKRTLSVVLKDDPTTNSILKFMCSISKNVYI